MRLSLELLMENSSARIVKQTNQNICFGLVVKVSKSWLFIVLVLMPKSLLACWGGGNSGGGKRIYSKKTNTTLPPFEDDTFENYLGEMDDVFKPNLTGVVHPVDRNIQTAGNGWEPSNKTKKEWHDWYLAWQEENTMNEANEEGGKREDGDERGQGSGWPKLPGWTDLGKGSSGVSIPPWAYVPKNIGKPNICYLPPLGGVCRPGEEAGLPGPRFGFNPYTNQCAPYRWSGCGGTRNKFVKKAACEKHCMSDPPQTCSANTGIRDEHDKIGHRFDKKNLS